MKEIFTVLITIRSFKNPLEFKTSAIFVSSSVSNMYDLVQNFASQRQMP